MTLHRISQQSSPHLYIDVTGLREYYLGLSVVSGIQRVSLMIIRQALQELGSAAVSLIRFDGSSGTYVEAPGIEDINSNDVEGIRRILGIPQAPPTLTRHVDHKLEYSLKWAVREYHSLMGHSAYFSKRGTTIEQWKNFKRTNSTAGLAIYRPLRSDMRPCDKVLLLDFLHPDKKAFDAFPGFVAQGAEIISVAYDMIPVKYEHARLGAKKFFQFYDHAARHVSRYIAISKSAAEDLHDYLRTCGIDRPVTVVPLARERVSVAQSSQSSQPVSDIAGLEPGKFVLFVGSVDIRKNVFALARAWQDLSTRIKDLPTLVFAGRTKGWNNGDLLDLLKQTDNLGGKVKMVECPTDAELDWLYRNCQFTAFLSFYEGWGLPVGESIAYGKTAVISSATSLPEVGEDLVLYADPHDHSAITHALERMLTEPGLRSELEAKIATRKLRTWEDVAHDMVSAAFGPVEAGEPQVREDAHRPVAQVA